MSVWVNLNLAISLGGRVRARSRAARRSRFIGSATASKSNSLRAAASDKKWDISVTNDRHAAATAKDPIQSDGRAKWLSHGRDGGGP